MSLYSSTEQAANENWPKAAPTYKPMTADEIAKVDPIIQSPADQLRFIMSSKRGVGSVFTLKSRTGKHHTYSVVRALRNDSLFVSLHDGRGYRFIGIIFADGTYHHGVNGSAKMAIAANPIAAHGFLWLMGWLRKSWDISKKGAEFWHSGSCCRCGHKLTDPESIRRGIGPICLKKVQS